MTRPVLVLRPQPGADATAARARAAGLEPIVEPLFEIVPRQWQWSGTADALLVTSANAARLIDGRPDRSLPAYAVGEATAATLRDQGFFDVRVGTAGVQQVVEQAAADGVGAMLHLAGEERTAFDAGPIRIDTRIVYRADPLNPSPAFQDALARGAVALLHSARAARRFAELAGTGHSVAALSQSVLAATGPWRAYTVAERPTDDALLAAAARLCQGWLRDE